MVVPAITVILFFLFSRCWMLWTKSCGNPSRCCLLGVNTLLELAGLQMESSEFPEANIGCSVYLALTSEAG